MSISCTSPGHTEIWVERAGVTPPRFTRPGQRVSLPQLKRAQIIPYNRAQSHQLADAMDMQNSSREKLRT